MGDYEKNLRRFSFADHARDDICAGLQRLGIEIEIRAHGIGCWTLSTLVRQNDDSLFHARGLYGFLFKHIRTPSVEQWPSYQSIARRLLQTVPMA